MSVSKVLLTYPQCNFTKEQLLESLKTLDDYECCVISREDHHETDGQHLHAFVKFKKVRKIRSNLLSRMFDLIIGNVGRHPNIELVKNRKDDIKRVIQYVIKDGDILVDNCDLEALTSNSHRKKYNTKYILETDIMKLVERDEIAAKDFMAVLKAQQTYRLMTPAPNETSTRGIWLHGKSGCGKSTWARAFGLDYGGFFLKQQNKWWDGYRGEPVVIIDDLDTPILNHYLKIWGDKWATTGEVKGATINLYYKYIVITSNYSIEEIVGRGLKNGEAFDQDLYESLARRFEVRELTEGQQYFTYTGNNYFIDGIGEIKKIIEVEESSKSQEENIELAEPELTSQDIRKSPGLATTFTNEEIENSQPDSLFALHTPTKIDEQRRHKRIGTRYFVEREISAEEENEEEIDIGSTIDNSERPEEENNENEDTGLE